MLGAERPGYGNSCKARSWPWQYLRSLTGEVELEQAEVGEGKEERNFWQRGTSHSKTWN